MAAITVLLKVTVDENGEDEEYGRFDSSSAPEDVAAWCGDVLPDRTRKEHEYPWRIINVELVRG